MTSSLTNTLAKARDEVVESKKLVNVLRRLLEYRKHQAKGMKHHHFFCAAKFVAIDCSEDLSMLVLCRRITLDSLMKAAKKKGSDGKTTVLDVVVMHDKSDVEFPSDLPTIRDVMRLDLDDLLGLLREIQMQKALTARSRI